MIEWEYLVMSLLAAGAVFFGWNELEAGKRYQLGEYLDLGTLKAADGGEGDMMQWGDAIGLGAFAVIGAMNGLRANSPMLITCLCGMMTCTFGGLTRDTLLNRPVRILHPYSDGNDYFLYCCSIRLFLYSILFPYPFFPSYFFPFANPSTFVPASFLSLRFHCVQWCVRICYITYLSTSTTSLTNWWYSVGCGDGKKSHMGKWISIAVLGS